MSNNKEGDLNKAMYFSLFSLPSIFYQLFLLHTFWCNPLKHYTSLPTEFNRIRWIVSCTNWSLNMPSSNGMGRVNFAFFAEYQWCHHFFLYPMLDISVLVVLLCQILFISDGFFTAINWNHLIFFLLHAFGIVLCDNARRRIMYCVLNKEMDFSC